MSAVPPLSHLHKLGREVELVLQEMREQIGRVSDDELVHADTDVLRRVAEPRIELVLHHARRISRALTDTGLADGIRHGAALDAAIFAVWQVRQRSLDAANIELWRRDVAVTSQEKED